MNQTNDNSGSVGTEFSDFPTENSLNVGVTTPSARQPVRIIERIRSVPQRIVKLVHRPESSTGWVVLVLVLLLVLGGIATGIYFLVRSLRTSDDKPPAAAAPAAAALAAAPAAAPAAPQTIVIRPPSQPSTLPVAAVSPSTASAPAAGAPPILPAKKGGCPTGQVWDAGLKKCRLPKTPAAAAPKKTSPKTPPKTPKKEKKKKGSKNGKKKGSKGRFTGDGPSIAPTGLTALTDKNTNSSDWAMTWYSFQDNTPSNSTQLSSGRDPIPFVSVAIPFRFLKKFGGTLDYGQKLFISFLKGRRMPNGAVHTGWVQLEDFCGDNGDDNYCYQKVGGKKVPNVDLYIGDITKSGQDTSSENCDGPAGKGAEATKLYTGTPGTGEWITEYGGAAKGAGKCGDSAAGKKDHGKCYYYAAPSNTKKDCKG